MGKVSSRDDGTSSLRRKLKSGSGGRCEATAEARVNLLALLYRVLLPIS